MTRPSGPLRTLLLFLTAGAASLLLGFGAVTVSSALGAPADQDLGDAVVLDPVTVTAPATTPAPTSTSTPRKPGTTADPLVVGGSSSPSLTPDQAPAPAPNAPAPTVTHVPDHQPEQVVPVPPSSADGEHHRG